MRNSFFIYIALTFGLAITSALETCPPVNEDMETLIPHESDCTLFYICESGDPILFRCPTDLHFNPVLDVCDWPDQAGCKSGSIETTTTSEPTKTTPEPTTEPSTESTTEIITDAPVTGPEGLCPSEEGEYTTLLPHEDCEKFWSCSWGIAYETKCPTGLYFNPTLLVCDLPDVAGCTGDGSIVTTPAPTESTAETTTESTNEPSTESTTEITTDGPVTGPEGLCPSEEGVYATLLPHEDCEKFWSCSWGIAYETNCPGGLHFNPTLLVCDWPNVAGCTGDGPIVTTPAPTESTAETTTEPTTEPSTESTTEITTDGPVTGPEGLCPSEEGVYATLLPHEDCEKFWSCSWGIAYETKCPGGLHFNPTLLVCDWPNVAGCTGEGPIIITPTPTESTTESTTEPITEPTTESTTDEPVTTPTPTESTTEPSSESTTEITTDGPVTGPEGLCPSEEGVYATLLPHEDCEKFWSCSWGIAYETKCPGGLHFNPTLLVCDWPNVAGCTGEGPIIITPIPTESTTESTTEPITEPTTETPVTTDEPVTTPTPTESTTESTTEPSSESTTEITTDGPVTGPEGLCPSEEGVYATLLPHEDCEKFWSCSWGIAYETKCPGGLHFNPTLLVCDWPNVAGCTGEGPIIITPIPTESTTESTTEPITEPTTETPVTTDEPVTTPTPTESTTESTTEPSSESTTEITTDGPVTGPEGLCPSEEGVYATLLPHEDCEKFWSCSWGIAYETKCPGGLHFNPTLLVCDWPNVAGCTGDGPIVTTPTPTESTTESTTEPITEPTTESTTDEPVTTPTPTESTTESTAEPSSESTTEITTDAPVTGPEGLCPSEEGEYATLLPHEDCEKFWSCSWGIAYETKCPGGLHFNPTLLVCDWPNVAGCTGDGSIVTTPTPTESTTESTAEPSSESTTEITTDAPVTGPEGLCPSEEGEYATLLPHEDCEKFWSCSWGIAYETKCPGGLHFNPTLLVCDWPNAAGCTGDGSIVTTPTPTESTAETTTQSSTEPSSESTTEITTDAPVTGPEGLCPSKEGEYTALLPHEDCEKFWSCSWGIAYETKCPTGLHFNPTLSVCDLPDVAGCTGDGSIVTTPTPTESTTQSTTEIVTETTTQSTTEGTPVPGDGFCEAEGCPERNGKWVYFLTVPNDCTRFCKCDWGTSYLYTCPDDLYFNPELNVCDYKENVDCEM